MNPNEMKDQIMKELSRCSYCGLCEWVCPVLRVQLKRNYGPRGRLSTMIFALRDGLWTEAGESGVFTCLLCGACSTQCPAGIKLEEVIRLFRYYLTLTG